MRGTDAGTQYDWAQNGGDFTVGAYWNWGTFPGINDQASIANNLTSLMSSDPPNSISELLVGNSSSGTFNQSGGTLTVTNRMIVGTNGTAVGTYTFSGGTFNMTKQGGEATIIGDTSGASGIVNMSGTASYNTLGGEIWLSHANGSHGEWNLRGGTVVVSNWTAVGRNGDDGLLNISGGVWSNIAVNMTIASFAGNKGKVIVSGTGTLSSQGAIYVGEGGTGTMIISNGLVLCRALIVGSGGTAAGILRQGGGVLTGISGGGDWQIGANSGAYGYFAMTGGVLTSTYNFQIGATGNGIYEQTGGVLTNTGWPVVGRLGGGIGVANISGGIFDQAATGLRLILGEQGTGVMTITGTGLVNLGGGLYMAGNYGGFVGHGILNLNGGKLITPLIALRDAGADGVLNFNGGTLSPTVDSTSFFQGISSAYVYRCGGVIDTAGKNITVSQPLLAPQAYGVSNIAIADQGAGYMGPPLVLISGGSGTGATAIAFISDAGTVTNIQVTCPGTGYQSDDTVSISLSGGGYSVVAVTGTVTLAENISGGLTKSGSGTLTLNAAETYAGLTTISNGILKLAASCSLGNSAGINVSSGAVFDATALGGWTVRSNASIGGSGLVSNDVAMASGGMINPGNTNSWTTLTINGNLTASNNISYAWFYHAGAGTGVLADVTGTLTLPSAGTVDISKVDASRSTTGVMFKYGSLSIPDGLGGWNIRVGGVPSPGSVLVKDNRVIWRLGRGTVITIR